MTRDSSIAKPLQVAIQPDEITDRLGNRQSYSGRWAELARHAGMQVLEVDMYRKDWLTQLDGVDGFMWRCGPTQHERQLAKRVVPALEQGAGMLVFPSWRTIWHLEDKLAQYYLLTAADMPMPRTTVLWDRESALAWSSSARYPFVFKLSYGYRSTNVILVHSRAEAAYWVEQMFGPGLLSMGYRPTGRIGMLKRRARASLDVLGGRNKHVPNVEAGIEHGYFYAQELLPDNAFDTRVTIIGDRAFGYRRMNRPGDFRASGSGLDNADFDQSAVDLDAVRLAFQVAHALGADTLSTDVLRRNGEPVIGEVGSAYPAWTVAHCRGYWTLEGDPTTGHLHWHEGSMRAEDALFADFEARLTGRRVSAA